jgi:hypothetical protein
MAPRQFYGPNPNANAVREYLYGNTRAFVEGRGRVFTVTSGYRNNSDAHKAGAIDYHAPKSSEEAHLEAKKLSETEGDIDVIVEEGRVGPQPPGCGKNHLGGYRVITTYRNGHRNSVSCGDYEATHIHVQRRLGTTPEAFVVAHNLTPTTGQGSMNLNNLLAPTLTLKVDTVNFQYSGLSGITSASAVNAFARSLLSGQSIPSGAFGSGISSSPWSSSAPEGLNIPFPFSFGNQGYRLSISISH